MGENRNTGGQYPELGEPRSIGLPPERWPYVETDNNEQWSVSTPPPQPTVAKAGHGGTQDNCRDCAVLRAQAAGMCPRDLTTDTDTWLRDVDKVFHYLRDGTLTPAPDSVLTPAPGDRP